MSVSSGTRGKFSGGIALMLIIGAVLAVLALVTAVALTGSLGIQFAISWVISLVVGLLGAVWALNTFRDPLMRTMIGITVTLLGVVMLIAGIVPNIATILAVLGSFVLLFSFMGGLSPQVKGRFAAPSAQTR
ncbi:MAG: hypothetical protein E6L02_07705 [Thaumarchaeota archaeon]|nr:MAG: hypothetical protein E6L02_07705 [Nitrososphaerota archaeon]